MLNNKNRECCCGEWYKNQCCQKDIKCNSGKDNEHRNDKKRDCKESSHDSGFNNNVEKDKMDNLEIGDNKNNKEKNDKNYIIKDKEKDVDNERGEKDKNKNCDSDKNSKICNRAYLNIPLCDKIQTIESNEVVIHKIDVLIEKTASCEYTFVGDKITYCQKIKNKSNINLKHVEFKDFLNEETEYIENSFKVDGNLVCPKVCGHEISYTISELKAHTEISITFLVKIL